MNEVGFSLAWPTEVLALELHFNKSSIFFGCHFILSVSLGITAAASLGCFLTSAYIVSASPSFPMPHKRFFFCLLCCYFSYNYILKLKYLQVASFLLSLPQFKLPLGSIHGPAFITLICKWLKALHLQLSFLTSKTLLFLTHFAWCLPSNIF